jgi:ABC-type uncharacterized transport system involved in gliding motility auxiliary subunit
VEGLTVNRIVGLLGWLGVVLVLAAVALRFTRPDLQPWYQGLAIGGLVVTGLYALTQWREIARSIQGRNVKYGSLTAGSVVLFVAILSGINWIGTRQNKRWDLTGAQQFTLSDQTRQVVRELDRPVKATAFYNAQTGSESVYRDTLDEYAYLSSQFTAEYVDADKDPARATGLGVQTLPTIVFEYDGRVERTGAVDEQSLTNALKKIVLGRAKKVYFLQGHGERDADGGDASGYLGMAKELANDNFEVAKLNLAQAGSIPDDATVLIVAGPTADALPAEIDLIKAFLGRGGKLLLLLDPPDLEQRSPPAAFIELAREWGINVGSDIIIDQSGLGRLVGGGAETPVAMPVPHPITSNFNLFTAFRLARSVAPVEGGANGRTAQKFLESSAESWAETDLKALYSTGTPERNLDKGDTNGPVSIAAAVSAAVTTPAPAPATPETPADADAPTPETRVAVIGDSDFGSNRYLNVPGNAPVFLNTVNWLAQQENLIAIRPKAAESRPLSMTADQFSLLRLFTMIVFPLLLVGNAVRIWWKRR